jgi:hypothetical protein
MTEKQLESLEKRCCNCRFWGEIRGFIDNDKVGYICNLNYQIDLLYRVDNSLYWVGYCKRYAPGRSNGSNETTIRDWCGEFEWCDL